VGEREDGVYSYPSKAKLVCQKNRRKPGKVKLSNAKRKRGRNGCKQKRKVEGMPEKRGVKKKGILFQGLPRILLMRPPNYRACSPNTDLESNLLKKSGYLEKRGKGG